MIDPQFIDIHSLPSVAIKDPHLLPGVQIAYWVIDFDGTILRVGTLLHPRKGFMSHYYSHNLKRFPNARIYFLALPDYDAGELIRFRHMAVQTATPALRLVRHPKKTCISMALDRSLVKRFNSVLKATGVSRAGTLAQLIEGWLSQHQEVTQ